MRITLDETSIDSVQKLRKQKRHGLQISVSMKLTHIILKRDNKPCKKVLLKKEVFKDQLKDLVRGCAQKSQNEILEAEAEKLCHRLLNMTVMEHTRVTTAATIAEILQHL